MSNRANRILVRKNSRFLRILGQKKAYKREFWLVKFSISQEYNIRVLREDTHETAYNSIKLEMISKNSAKKPINFSANKYFSKKSKRIMSYMDYISKKQREAKAKQEVKPEKPIKKRVKKAARKMLKIR